MTIAEVVRVLESIAPLRYAQNWDNVGLLVGSKESDCKTLLLTIDLTHQVLQEAIDAKTDCVVSYHPPLFKPIRSILAQSNETDSIMWNAIRHNISVYSVHTALDAAPGGTNDVLAGLCGAVDIKPFEYVEESAGGCKVVTFVPQESVEQVAEAMSAAGGGQIGDYSRCSFRIPGTGTFQGGAETRPTVGTAGRYETVGEIRLEMAVPAEKVSDVLDALRRAHPYEEPAYDVYALKSGRMPGAGRIGAITGSVAVGRLVDRLQGVIPGCRFEVVGDLRAAVERVVVCAGASGSMPFKAGLGRGDCVVTGEIRHHDALAINRHGAAAIALGHWASERPVLASLAKRLEDQLDGVQLLISRLDRDPFASPETM